MFRRQTRQSERIKEIVEFIGIEVKSGESAQENDQINGDGNPVVNVLSRSHFDHETQILHKGNQKVQTKLEKHRKQK